jgi:parallel beta-helix repeat protein
MSLTTSGSRYIQGNTFSGISGSAIRFGQNTTITENTLTNTCTNSVDCGAIRNAVQDIYSGSYIYDTLDLLSTISSNIISNVGSGIVDSGYQDGIYLDNLSRSVTVSGNTISAAQTAITIKNGRYHTVSGNTIFNPRARAIHMLENTETYTGVVQSNTVNNNTILTYNPNYSMIRIDDQIDAIGVLATLSGNKYINVYKGKLPIIEILRTGGISESYDKTRVSIPDAGATNFTYFGYKAYTNTGSLGANLITNSTFSANIAGWSTDVLSLTQGAGVMDIAQGIDPVGRLWSNSFSLTAGTTYEITGNITNTTGTG